MSAAQQAQQHNRSIDGRYATALRGETDLDFEVAAAVAEESSPTLTLDSVEALFGEPDAAIKGEAHVFARIQTANRHSRELSWGTIMGAKARRTTAAMERYWELVDERIAADPDMSAYHRRYQDSVATRMASQRMWARAYDAGLSTDADAEFEAIWEGRLYGTSREQVLTERARNLRSLELLTAGQITPSSIIGTGYRNPRRSAEEYLRGQIADQDRTIATHGRTVNVAFVPMLRERKRQLRHARFIAPTAESLDR